MQARREPLRRHHPQLGNGELDRHRDAVEMLADVRDRGGIGIGQREAVDRGGGALDEQPDGAVIERLRGRDAFGAARKGQTRDPVGALSADTEGLAARGEEKKRRAPAHELLGEVGRRFDEVLAVVEDEKRLLLAQISDRAVDRRAAALHRNPDRGADGLGHEPRVFERRELCDPDPVGIVL